MNRINRRSVLSGLAIIGLASSAWAEALPEMIVYKDPNCGCCGAWVDHVRASGLRVNVIEDAVMANVKARLGVPPILASCHTAQIGGYVVEGHVPATEILRLIREKPQAKGLAVPGMPTNSPGMEVPGAPSDVYNVMQFASDGSAQIFATYRGSVRA